MNPLNIQKTNLQIFDKLDETGIAAVVILDKLEHTRPLVESLLLGGVNAIELTLRTPAALDAAKIIKADYPEMMLGFGTVINLDQVKAIVDIGADFAFAPGCNPRIIDAAQKNGLPFVPGVMTPTDIEMALELGCRILKYFPAETSGGMSHLKSMVAPYQYLGLKFIPLGGINLSNARNYLESPLITAVGGSWIAKRDLILEENWASITKNALEIRTLIDTINKEQ
jgi:2-dehydro-3-deoxyphosphogluconate aldolase/(4S)-4-hydroxy-2-oxoglutarate aldolase